MDKSLNDVEGLIELNLFGCPLMESFVSALSFRLASREIVITDEVDKGNLQEALFTARGAIFANCTDCISRDFHKPIADAVPPQGKPGENVEKYDPTIVIHTI